MDIKDYEIISNKEKSGENNEKGINHIINKNKLIFEGEYLNGKRNGKGKKYYDDGKLMYEGEYLNGKRNGKGKEYFKNGKLKFEGEYLKGKKWNGNEYNKNGSKEFEIENGCRKVKQYYDFIYLK